MAVQVNQLGLDCHACDEILQKERGCNSAGILPYEFNNERFFRCPKKLVTDDTWGYLTAHRFYEKSILPNGKGWMFQSAKLIQALIIIDAELMKQQNESAKDGRQSNKRTTHADR